MAHCTLIMAIVSVERFLRLVPGWPGSKGCKGMPTGRLGAFPFQVVEHPIADFRPLGHSGTAAGARLEGAAQPAACRMPPPGALPGRSTPQEFNGVVALGVEMYGQFGKTQRRFAIALLVAGLGQPQVHAGRSSGGPAGSSSYRYTRPVAVRTGTGRVCLPRAGLIVNDPRREEHDHLFPRVVSVWSRKRKPTQGMLPSTGMACDETVFWSRSRPPMTTVQPSRTMMFDVTSVTVSLGRVKLPLTVTSPSESSGWTSIRIMPSRETKGRRRSCTPVCRKSTVCVDDVSVTVCYVALLVADKDSARCLFEDHKAGLGDHVGVADRLQGGDEGADVAVQVTELQTALVKGHTGQARGRRSPAELHVVLQGEEIDAKLVAVVELDAHDHGLDPDLQRPHVDLGDDLFDPGEHGLVVADQDHVAARIFHRHRLASLAAIPALAAEETLTMPIFSVISGWIRLFNSAAVT